jgi:metal-sulfur cluster biosynthetic enzyme
MQGRPSRRLIEGLASLDSLPGRANGPLIQYSRRPPGHGRQIMAFTEKDIRNALKTVKDPELNLDLVVLGLVYDIEVDEANVKVTMSLTSPMCPVAGQIVEDARTAVLTVEGVEEADVQLTFDPPWTPERISPLIRSSLGL